MAASTQIITFTGFFLTRIGQSFVLPLQSFEALFA